MHDAHAELVTTSLRYCFWLVEYLLQLCLSLCQLLLEGLDFSAARLGLKSNVCYLCLSLPQMLTQLLSLHLNLKQVLLLPCER